MKIDVKNKENQRLSMANEQLQFRLQSQPNLSLTNIDYSFNSQNTSNTIDQLDQQEHQTESDNPKLKLTRASTLTFHSYNSQNSPSVSPTETQASNSLTQSSLSSMTHELSSSTVKLRSKSFKTHPSRSSDANKKLFSSYHQNVTHRAEQFRPVSESFDFNSNDRDAFMTRSVIMYDSNQSSLMNNNDFECLQNDVTNEADCVSSIDACDSTTSSNSHLESNHEGDTVMMESNIAEESILN